MQGLQLYVLRIPKSTEFFPELGDDFSMDPMCVSWQDFNEQPSHGGASNQESNVSSSNLPVPNRAEMHTSEEELYHLPRRSPRFTFPPVLDSGDIHHYQRTKIFVYDLRRLKPLNGWKL